MRPQEIEEMVDAPEEFDILPSDFVDNSMFEVSTIQDSIGQLYRALDALQDLLYEKDL